MVNQVTSQNVTVTSQNVTDILNSNTSRVADLKKKFTLGSIGYNLFKLFSCFISNSNPTKQKIQQAETIDKMPTLIKKTAEKISKLLKKGEFSPGIISQRVELLASRKEAHDMSDASVKDVKQTNQLQDAMLTLTSQAKKLADAYGHSNTSASAYVQALSGLVKQDFDISGQNYLVLSAIQSYTDAFAAKGAFEVATGLDTFISEMHQAFKDLSPEFITTHIYRQLSETNLSSKIEGSKALFTQDKAVEAAEVANEQDQERIEEIASGFNDTCKTRADEILEKCHTKQTEIYTLRGPDGNNGMIHNAWIEFMNYSCRYTLEANRLTTDTTAKLSKAEEKLLLDYVSNKDTNREVLKEQEKKLHEIFARPGFNRISFKADEAISPDAHKSNEDLIALRGKKDEAYKNYQELDARLKELLGGNIHPEFHEKTIKVGNYEVTAEMDIATQRELENIERSINNEIDQIKVKMNKTTDAISAEFADKTKLLEQVENKLAYAKEHLFPSYKRTDEQNFPFAQFADNIKTK